MSQETGALCDTPGATLYYEVIGSGAGTALFVLHGGPGFDHSYFHLATAWNFLAKNRRIVFYDQRGTGRSPALKPGQSCTLSDQIDDLDALRSRLGFERIHLLGHSWGGYLAMAHAARHPERVASLVLVDSVAPRWSDTLILQTHVFPEIAARREAVTFADQMGAASAAESRTREYLSMLFYSPEKRDAFLASMPHAAFQKDVNQAILRDLARFDLNPEIRKFRFPALVVTGRYDMNVAPSVAYQIHQAIPGSRFTVFEKSGHFPFYEEPDSFARVVEEFLSGR